MNRDYDSGKLSNVAMFVGKEVEKTKYFGMQTLFVADTNFDKSYSQRVIKAAKENKCEAIYLAANHVFVPAHETTWLKLAVLLVAEGFYVTLEVEAKYLTDMMIKFSERYNFVLMIGLPVPNIHDNIVIKADDVDFKATNPGVWTMNPTASDVVHFTPWEEYTKDTVLQ